ncbi:hypothetical protein RHGRI_019805 [Rhododendron griersonianum]|uniref:Alcohol dehydrogenase N-terminal domain-containing protein n=1 Tax=Rhododendron griersonianum TaxID=479676 RepID=A0AAV6JJB1_9ERIC|nr:hypothetical protein RHGRI_019805 [Rhododendron griersonianum]
MGSLQDGASDGKVITCKAAVAWGPGQPLVIEDVCVDPPQKMEVRVKILFTSICHTDLSAWQGESVGEGVTDMKEGDHVVPIFNGECGDCVYCKRDKTNLCEKFRVNPFNKVMANDGLGGAWNTANVKPGSTVAVFGLGAVGLAKIREITGGGVDYSFECAGNVDVLREAFLSTHDGWGLTVVLGVHPTPRMLPLHPMELFDGRRIVGSVFGDFKGKSQLPHFVKECTHGEVNLEEFITHELPFSQINEAFQLLIDGKSLRCLLHL